MATAKKPASKAANKLIKPAGPVKNTAPKVVAPAAKKPVAVKESAVKTAITKSSKALPVKAAPDKKAATPTAAPVKKQTLSKTNDKNKPAAKAAAKPASAPAKKAAPVTAKAPVKSAVKAAPAKATAAKTASAKAVPVKAATAKAAPAKKVPAAPVAKASAKAATAKKEVPAAKVPAVKVVTAKPVKPARPKKAAKTLTKTAAQLMPQKPAPKPSPAPAAFIGREEKKTNIIVAHRRLENKNPEADDNGKTMINYKPDFTRSILGVNKEEKTGPVYRYSDEELNEFRELIQNRLEKARKELTYQQGLITRKDEAGTEDTENRYMNMEDGSGAMEREQLAQLASRQIQFINHLEKALIRIENKTYGICRVTGNLIDKNRLRAVPHATLSIDAKNQLNKK